MLLVCVLWSILHRALCCRWVQVNNCLLLLGCHSGCFWQEAVHASGMIACLQVCAGRFANPYKLLDLKPDADLRQIKRAYRKKALQ